MKKTRKTRRTKPLTYAYAIRSFVGFLEGTEKSLHTIQSYRSDLRSFQDFLERRLAKRKVSLAKVTLKDLETYHDFLKTLSLRTNTRRRKLLTVRRLFRYLNKRKKLSDDVSLNLAAPYKVEKVPQTVSIVDLLKKIRKLPETTEIELRNKVLLWTLAETGALVSEVSRLEYESWLSGVKEADAQLSILGKASRQIPVSSDLFQAVHRLLARAKKERSQVEEKYVFLGFNKFGPLVSKNGSAPISPRGVEMTVKAYGPRLGVEGLTPRTFRHSIVVSWLKAGVSQEEVQKRLGLKTNYAFRSYEPLIENAASS